MPLDFTKDLPPTLGRRKTTSEIKKKKDASYDVRNGLRSQGGFVNVFNDWDRKKQKEYAAMVSRQRGDLE